MPKVELTTDSYDRLKDPDDASKGIKSSHSRGDVIDLPKEEAERLIEIGAAVDPQAEHEKQRQALEDKRAQLEAQRAEIDAKLQGLDEPRSEGEARAAALKGKALNDALKEHNLPAEGSVEEKRARLAGAIDSGEHPA